MSGSATSRIDTIICNRNAAHLVRRCGYEYSKAVGFDHVALSLNLNREEYEQEMWVMRTPTIMNILQYHEMDQKARQQLDTSHLGSCSQWPRRHDYLAQQVSGLHVG